MARLLPALFRVAVLASATLLVIGCGPEEEETKTHEQITGTAGVDLPEKPNLEAVLGAERTYPDGSLKVIGLILERAERLGTEVQVRGVIREVSLDCPFITDPNYLKPKAGERELKKCEALYITIADNASHPKELVLTGYDQLTTFNYQYLHPHLKPGMEIVVQGTYDTHGAGFIRPRDGLLVVQDVLNMAVECTPRRDLPCAELTFHSDPAEVARVKTAINEAMAKNE